MELLAGAGAVFLFIWSNWSKITLVWGRLIRFYQWYRASEVEPKEGQLWSSLKEENWAEILESSETGIKVKFSQDEEELSWEDWETKVQKDRAYYSGELTIEDRYWGRDREEEESE